MLDVAKIKAISIDLDDTLWPIWPTIEKAEKALHDWLGMHAPMAAALFSSSRTDANEMTETIRWAWDQCGELIDPHTACGLHAARVSGIDASIPVVTLATAHPAKFPEAVERATGQRPSLPGRVGDLFEREERCTDLPGEYDAIADYVAGLATPKG